LVKIGFAFWKNKKKYREYWGRVITPTLKVS
jgi:hypothetical protein